MSFEEASTVFDDPWAYIFDDKGHSLHDRREIIIGHSRQNRLLLTCFVERTENVIRIISARLATKKERHDYEENTPSKSRSAASDDLRVEYNFDYRQARPNRFADRKKDHRTVVLDPDVAEVFTTPEAVNSVLRALIATMPPATKRKAAAK